MSVKKPKNGPLSFDPTGDWGGWNAVCVKFERKGKRPIKKMCIPEFLDAFENSLNYAKNDGNVWFLQDTYWAICDKISTIETRMRCILQFDDLKKGEYGFYSMNQFNLLSHTAWSHATDGPYAIVPVSDVKSISEGMKKLRENFLQYVADDPGESRRRFDRLRNMKTLTPIL